MSRENDINKAKTESPGGGPPRQDTKFCQQASKRYEDLLNEALGDPRVAAGAQALRDLKRTGGWAPALDARDARVVVKEGGDPK